MSLSGEKEEHDPVEAIARINCWFMLKSAGDKRRGTEYLHGKLKFLNEVCLIKFQIIQTKDTSSKSF